MLGPELLPDSWLPLPTCLFCGCTRPPEAGLLEKGRTYRTFWPLLTKSQRQINVCPDQGLGTRAPEGLQ